MKLNGIKENESDDAINFSYSSGEEFPLPDLVTKKKPPPNVAEKDLKKSPQPTSPAARGSSPHKATLPNLDNPATTFADLLPPTRTIIHKREDLLSREKKRRRLSSMIAPKPSSLPNEPKTTSEVRIAGNERLQPSVERSKAQSPRNVQDGAQKKKKEHHALSSISKSEREASPVRVKPSPQEPQAFTVTPLPHTNSMSSSKARTGGSDNESSHSHTWFKHGKLNGFPDSGSSSSESSDSEDWEPKHHKKKKAKKKMKKKHTKSKSGKSVQANTIVSKKTQQQPKWPESDSEDDIVEETVKKTTTSVAAVETNVPESNCSGSSLQRTDRLDAPDELPPALPAPRQEENPSSSSSSESGNEWQATSVVSVNGKAVNKTELESAWGDIVKEKETNARESDSDSDDLQSVKRETSKPAPPVSKRKKRHLLDSSDSDSSDEPYHLTTNKVQRSRHSPSPLPSHKTADKISKMSRKTNAGSEDRSKSLLKPTTTSSSKPPDRELLSRKDAARPQLESHKNATKFDPHRTAPARQLESKEKKDSRRRPGEAEESSPAKKLRLFDIDFTGGRGRSNPPPKGPPRGSLLKKLKSQLPYRPHMHPKQSPSAPTLGNRVKPTESDRSTTVHRDDKTDRPRVVNSGASNVLRASPHLGKNGRIPAPSPSINNTHSSPASQEHSRKHGTLPAPSSHSLLGQDPSKPLAPSNPSTRHTDTFAQKDAILAAKFPQKRQQLIEHGSSEKLPRTDTSRNSSLLRPHHKSIPH